MVLSVAAFKGQILYGTLLLFTYALGHCLLMLAVGTFTDFVEAFATSRGDSQCFPLEK